MNPSELRELRSIERGLAGGRGRIGASGEPFEPCPICERPMVPGPSVDRHHFVPKSRGGRETALVHKVCHRKIHSLWTEAELERDYSDAESVRAHPDVRKFVAWVRRKHPEFYDRTATSAAKTRKRR